MKNAISLLIFFVCLIVPESLFAQQSAPAAPVQSSASVPHLIRFGGVLHDLAGKPIAGTVDVTFSLYSNEADGAPLWYETQTIQADALGNYMALLGAMTTAGVPMELFTEGQAHWLGVMVQGLPEQARVLLVSVPYAMKAGDAETLGGRPASEYQLTSQASTSSDLTHRKGTTTSTRDGSTSSVTKTSSPTPQVVTTTQSYIPIFANNTGTLTNSVMFQSGSRIGIGTTTPSFGLDLNSNVFAIGPKAAQPGAGGTMRFRDDTATVRWAFGLPGSAGATDFFLSNPTNGRQPLYIQGGAGSFMLYLNASSNLGVSTNSPSFPLDLNGNVLAVGTKTAKSTFGGSVRFRDDTGTVRWALGLPGTAAATNFSLSNLVAATTPLLVEATAPTNSLYVKSTGNVGVGTAAPTSRLHVLAAGTAASGDVFAVDGIAGECSGTQCAAVDAISQGTNGIGLFAEATGSGGVAGQFNGAVLVSSYIAINQPGSGLLVTSPDNSHCAQIGIDNGGNLAVTAITCPVKRVLRSR